MKQVSSKIEGLINDQIKREYNNSMLYQAMSEWLNYNGWFGGAELYAKHSEEERGHGIRFANYLQDRDALPITPSPELPQRDFKDIEDILNKTYEKELDTTKNIVNIAKVSIDEGDLVTYQALNWFINEQISEESDALFWIDKVEMYKETNKPLGDLDKEFKHKSKKFK